MAYLVDLEQLSRATYHSKWGDVLKEVGTKFRRYEEYPKVRKFLKKHILNNKT